MTSRELVIKTLNHEPVPRVPRDLWLPAGEDSSRADELAEMNVRYPSDILTLEAAPSHGKRSQGKPGKAGDFTDAWGCVWHVADEDAPPELKHSPLADASQIASYQPPAELLDRSRFAKANKICPTTNRFVLAWSEVRPFDRLRLLRGSEAALVDLARGTKDIRGLLAMLHEFACKELELWAATRGRRRGLPRRLGLARRAADLRRKCGETCSARCTATTARSCTPRTSSSSSTPTATSPTSSAIW